MFENLVLPPPDEILELMHEFRTDSRLQKVDLGVGVYKNHLGNTPIMDSVKKAEKKLWEQESTKSYVGLTGDPFFHQMMIDLILGSSFDRDRAAAAATPGGTGALRQGLELIKMANPSSTIWLSNPTWPNHPSIVDYLRLKTSKYSYFDFKNKSVLFEDMLTDLSNANHGDVVLLHGCCHNPTGANLSQNQWVVLGKFLNEKNLIPLIDIAYQGFGDGIETDSLGVRYLVDLIPETIIASSCSKNFGIYRERTGIIIVTSKAKKQKHVNQALLAYLNRNNFSFPPDHGSKIVSMILSDTELRNNWEIELDGIRQGMQQNRETLVMELRNRTGSDRFGFLSNHRGMFSLLGASKEQVTELRVKHGVYAVSDSRINIAALNEENIPYLADAIVAVGV
jgi:aromatic-amino-acid transaminase